MTSFTTLKLTRFGIENHDPNEMMLGSNLEEDYLNSILEKLDKGYSMET
nr:hypothetical protein [uncultured Draconibacterium sp.]